MLSSTAIASGETADVSIAVASPPDPVDVTDVFTAAGAPGCCAVTAATSEALEGDRDGVDPEPRAPVIIYSREI